MASCSWGQPPDNYKSDETETESDSSEFDFDSSESDNTDYDISDFDPEVLANIGRMFKYSEFLVT